MEIIKSITHPDEIFALLKFKMGYGKTIEPAADERVMCYSLNRCYEMLEQTSRSYAWAIRVFEVEMRDAMCMLYLVLRAVDTIEDDMNIPPTTKVRLLKEMHKLLLDETWNFQDTDDKHGCVLKEFNVISTEFRKLKPMYASLISDVCRKMGRGMASYIVKRPRNMDDWDEYTHYALGLVGITLSRIFSGSTLEHKSIGEDEFLANSMALLLQKTNMIRDFYEDGIEGRGFWPKSVWCKYVKTVNDLMKPKNIDVAVKCLNELICDALLHVSDSITYMSRLKNPMIFNFVAIQQMMAITTLERCYDNPNVFRSIVKIRKGEAVKIVERANSIAEVKQIFAKSIYKISSRARPADPSTIQLMDICRRNLAIVGCPEELRFSTKQREFMRMYGRYVAYCIAIGMYALQRTFS